MSDINTPQVRERISNLLHEKLADDLPPSRIAETVSALFVLMNQASADADQPRRVWQPGDELPVGVWVMGPDSIPVKVQFPGAQVDAFQEDPTPLVEVVLPDYAAEVARDTAARTETSR